MARHDVPAAGRAGAAHRADGAVRAARTLRAGCGLRRWRGEGARRRAHRSAAWSTIRRRGAIGGVAGHAGLFTTADDLARFCRMLLGHGTLDGVRILSPLSVARMTAPSTPAAEPNVRGLGWDLDSSFSSNRGELFPLGSFGHTGFTGTSMWIDPATSTYVVVLANRVHPEGKGDVVPLRARVATIVAAAIDDRARGRVGRPRRPSHARRRRRHGRGADRAAGAHRHRRAARRGLRAPRRREGRAPDQSHRHRPRRHVDHRSPAPAPRTSRWSRSSAPSTASAARWTRRSPSGTRREDRAADPLALRRHAAADRGDAGRRRHHRRRHPGHRRPLLHLRGDRWASCWRKRRGAGIAVVVLDRPNPIDGWRIEGPLTDETALGFTSYLRMPIRHGLTIGELAQLFNGERRIGAKLSVVAPAALAPRRWFDDTGLPWINPSPNMRSLTEATLYPGLGAIEATQHLGRPRHRHAVRARSGRRGSTALALAAALNARRLPGVRVYPIRFTPASSVYAQQACGGVAFVVTDREALRPVRAGHGSGVGAGAPLPRPLPPRSGRSSGRFAGDGDADSRRRGSSGGGGLVGRRRGAVATAAGEVPDLYARIGQAAGARQPANSSSMNRGVTVCDASNAACWAAVIEVVASQSALGSQAVIGP